ncbi:hypothetical protein KC874_05060 [Candidatus Saccharibacteria bacterium]|jgi:hypothetical protein|nr:hypothetical protein [Candidatus Saccharibacteria bacterium]
MSKSIENNSQIVRDAATGKLFRVSKRYPGTISDPNQQLLEQAPRRRQKAYEPKTDTQDFFSYQEEQSVSFRKLKLKSVTALAGVVLAGVYAGSVLAHPLDGFRSPSEYAQTWQKIGKMATDTIGITDSNDNQPNTGEETNE